MKFMNHIRAAARALPAVVALLFAGSALAQTVTQMPAFVAPKAVLDLGNGPTEIQLILGNGGVFTSQSFGLGATASSTAVTLAATPAVPPCVGCGISGPGIPANDTVAAYNGTTGITLATAATATAGSVALSWGAACPVSTQAAPVQPVQPMALLQAAVAPATTGLYLYTTARICAWGGNSPGMQFVTFAPGAH